MKEMKMKKFLVGLILSALIAIPQVEALEMGAIIPIARMSDCSGMRGPNFCLDTDDGKIYYYDGTSVVQIPTAMSPVLTGDVTINADLGTEIAPAMTDANWTKGTGWTITGGVATATAGTGSTLVPASAIVPVAGANYKIQFVLTASAGSITMTFGGTLGTIRTASGTYTSYVTAADGSNLTFTKDSSFAGTITSVTVKVVTHGSLTVEGAGTYASRMMLESGSAYAPAIVWDDANKLGIFRFDKVIFIFALGILSFIHIHRSDDRRM
jgi:roadblock/LC7 domain-containing protein